MNKFLVIGLLAKTIKTAAYWFEIGDGVADVVSLTLSGPQQEYFVHGSALNIRTHSIDWVAGQPGNLVKTVAIAPNPNILAYSPIQGDSTFNVVVASKLIFRVNVKPGEPDNYQEYAVPTRERYSYPVWRVGTNYMFIASRSFPVLDRKLYRLHSDRISEVKVFDTATNTRSYGILSGTPWLIVSMSQQPTRKLYDYTNGYVGGSNSVVQTHSKSATTSEIGLMSPEDQRGFYVVGELQNNKII